MSTKFESPTRYTSDLSDNDSVASLNSTPYNKITPTNITDSNNASIHQEFLNALQARQFDHQLQNSSTGWSKKHTPSFYRHQIIEDLAPIESSRLNELMKDINKDSLLLIDVRSFDHFSKNRIKSAVHVSIPSVLLKRSTYTMEKVCEAVNYDEKAAERFKRWKCAANIVFYDHSSYQPSDSGNSATALLLGSKLRTFGFKGKLNYLQGGLNSFNKLYPHQCEMTPIDKKEVSKKEKNRPQSIQLPLPTSDIVSGGPAMNPFFTNIRQNLELSHGPLKERFAVRLPYGLKYENNIIKSITSSPLSTSFNSAHHPRFGLAGSSVDQDGNFQPPIWLRNIIDAENGPKKLAEMYEKLERIEQDRLSTVMKYHAKDTVEEENVMDDEYFPFSITSSMEKGTLNRYDNIWPYAYSRVKLSDKNDDYINANYIQYATIKDDITLSPINQSEEEIKLQKEGLLSQASLRTMNKVNVDLVCNRQYISTQGPLPTTFNDFWKLIWDERSFVIVMLTQEVEMNKIKCHRYWPSETNAPQQYGEFTITLVSESKQSVLNMNDKRERDGVDDEYIIVRKIIMKHGKVERKITHLQYTGWTDFGVPDQPVGILQLVHRADEAARYHQYRVRNIGPMTVHCSAGCGRSGTFCVIDTIIQRLWHEQDVYTAASTDKIKETVNRFREQRMSMVQTHRQFVFCYEAILWWLLGYGYLPASSSPIHPIVDSSFLPKIAQVVPTAPLSMSLFSCPPQQEDLHSTDVPEDQDQTLSLSSMVNDFKEL